MSKKVLVVDDQPGIRILLTEVIQSEGYKVYLAETGQEAINQVQDIRPDLMLLDFKLPVKDGLAVIRELDQLNLTTPSVIMSGLSDDDIRAQGLHSSVKDIITKPFDINDIRQLVVKLLSE